MSFNWKGIKNLDDFEERIRKKERERIKNLIKKWWKGVSGGNNKDINELLERIK